MAELFDAIARANTILLDLDRDVWGYISLGYFRQKLQGGRGRLVDDAAQGQPDRLRELRGQPRPRQRAAARTSREKLPISRWQRDLTDSTVLRNMGVALGYALLGYDVAARRASPSSTSIAARIAADLDANWEVLAEPVQTVMRRYGVARAVRAAEGADARRSGITRELAARVHRRPRAARRRESAAARR